MVAVSRSSLRFTAPVHSLQWSRPGRPFLLRPFLNHCPNPFVPPFPYIPLTPIQFAQELLSTFALSLGEVALIPSTGGVFVVEIFYDTSTIKAEDEDAREDEKSTGGMKVKSTRLWDRKVEGGFPGMSKS